MKFEGWSPLSIIFVLVWLGGYVSFWSWIAKRFGKKWLILVPITLFGPTFLMVVTRRVLVEYEPGKFRIQKVP